MNKYTTTPNNRSTTCWSIWFSKNSQNRHATETGSGSSWEYIQLTKISYPIIQASSLDARKELELSLLDDIKPIVF